ncbi:MAG: VOC family protein, partial [Gemmatimonadaceae bacterium]
ASLTIPAGTKMGHVHLHVSNLPDAEAFYAGVLGFELMQHFGGQAAFLSAGGYHHHVGLNTWAGVGAPAPPPGAIGLREFLVYLPSREEVERVAARVRAAGIPIETTALGLLVRDPSGNAVILSAGPRAS